jgi:hypothetical protein
VQRPGMQRRRLWADRLRRATADAEARLAAVREVRDRWAEEVRLGHEYNPEGHPALTPHERDLDELSAALDPAPTADAEARLAAYKQADESCHRSRESTRVESAAEFVERVVAGWRGGTGHTDSNKWISVATLRASLDPAPTTDAEGHVEALLVDYTRWLFDRQGVHEEDGRFTKLVPEFLAEREASR